MMEASICLPLRSPPHANATKQRKARRKEHILNVMDFQNEKVLSFDEKSYSASCEGYVKSGRRVNSNKDQKNKPAPVLPDDPSFSLSLSCDRVHVGNILTSAATILINKHCVEFTCPDKYLNRLYEISLSLQYMSSVSYHFGESEKILILKLTFPPKKLLSSFLLYAHGRPDRQTKCPDCDICEKKSSDMLVSPDMEAIAIYFSANNFEEKELLYRLSSKHPTYLSLSEVTAFMDKHRPARVASKEDIASLTKKCKPERLVIKAREVEPITVPNNLSAKKVEPTVLNNSSDSSWKSTPAEQNPSFEFHVFDKSLKGKVVCKEEKSPNVTFDFDLFDEPIQFNSTRNRRSATVKSDIERKPTVVKLEKKLEMSNSQQDFLITNTSNPHAINSLKRKEVKSEESNTTFMVKEERPDTKKFLNSANKNLGKTQKSTRNTGYASLVGRPKREQKKDYTQKREQSTASKFEGRRIRNGVPVLSEQTSKQNIAKPETSVKTDDKIYVFYPPSKNGVAVWFKDLECLQPGKWLNDTIIDFWFNYVTENLPPDLKETVTYFNSQFYYALSHPYSGDSNIHSLSEKQRRYERVRKWNKSRPIFKRDFIFIPINQDNIHWFFVVICYAGKVADRAGTEIHCQEQEGSSFQSLDEQEDIHDDIQCSYLEVGRLQKSPCIIVFDSLNNKYPNIVEHLRGFLESEYEERKHIKVTCSTLSIPAIYLEVPQQNNGYDCGVYLLQYLESFCQTFLVNYSSYFYKTKRWFPYEQIENKRIHVLNILKNLHEIQDRDGTLVKNAGASMDRFTDAFS